VDSSTGQVSPQVMADWKLHSQKTTVVTDASAAFSFALITACLMPSVSALLFTANSAPTRAAEA